MKVMKLDFLAAFVVHCVLCEPLWVGFKSFLSIKSSYTVQWHLFSQDAYQTLQEKGQELEIKDDHSF